MESEASLLWGVVLGSIGFGYFVYGKQQRRGIALAAGVALMLFPFFVANSWALVTLGAACMAAPFFLRV